MNNISGKPVKAGKPKAYKVKPKPKHYKLAEKLMETNGNAGKALKEVGYSEATAKNPKAILETKGFLQIADQLGLTDTLIADSLAQDIQSKPGNRVQELALGAKLRGLMVDRSESASISKIIVEFGD